MESATALIAIGFKPNCSAPTRRTSPELSWREILLMPWQQPLILLPPTF